MLSLLRGFTNYLLLLLLYLKKSLFEWFVAENAKCLSILKVMHFELKGKCPSKIY